MLLQCLSELTFRVDQCPPVSERCSDSGWKDAAVMCGAQGCIGMRSCGMSEAVDVLSSLHPGDLVRAKGRLKDVSVLFAHEPPRLFLPETERLWVPRALGADAYMVGIVLAAATIKDLTLANDITALAAWNRNVESPAVLVQVCSVYTPKDGVVVPANDPVRRFRGLYLVLLIDHPRQPRLEKVESWT